MVSAIENDHSQCSADGSCPDPTTLLQAGVKVNHEEKKASLEEESSKGLVDAAAVQEGSAEDSEEGEEDGNSEDEKEAEDEEEDAGEGLEEETGEDLEEETGEASDENADNRALLNFREEDEEDSAASRRRTPYGSGGCTMQKCNSNGGTAHHYLSTKCISARRRGWPGKYAEVKSKARCQGGDVPCGHMKCGIVSKITIEYCCYSQSAQPRRRATTPTPRRRSSSSPRRRSTSTPRRRQGTNEYRRRRFCDASHNPIKTTNNRDPWCCENENNA